MADERLGASFSIDVTNLKAGLAQANRLIRESESEFRAAAAGIDNWSESEEGLEKRQKSLNTQIGLQKEKTAALIKEKERIIEKMRAEGKSQEEIDKAIDSTNKQITKESKELDKLKSELDRTTSALDDLGEESDDAAKSIDKAGNTAEKSSGGFTVLKGALANLVADGFRKAIDAAKEFASSMVETAASVKAENSQYAQAFGDLVDDADKAVDKVAGTTGILRDRLTGTAASIYSFARSSGASTEEAMSLMEQSLMATADSAAYYDKSLEETAETLQSFLKGNFANDAALGVSATEFTRNAKATELFGKKYNDLSEIQKQQTLLKMVTDAQALSGAMGQASRESDGFENVMGNINETWRQFKSKVGTPVLEALIPVLQEATTGFQKFEKSINWKDFNKKATSALKNVIKEGKKLAQNDLPTLKTGLKAVGSAGKFVIENFETLAKVTLTAITVFKAFKAAMAISTAITTAKTAIAGLTAGVGLATKAQTGWNAVMSANPIGAVVTAVGLLAGGIALLVASQKDATTQQDLLSESQREAVTAAENAAEAYKETKSAAAELAGAELANINHTQTLWKELQTLADENGKVKEGYEGRAQFILNELNSALGTEYSLNDGIIQQYGDIKKSIEDVIEAKKAQILLDAYSDTYAEAIKTVTDLEKGRATQAQAIVAAQDRVKASQDELAEASKKYEEAIASGREYVADQLIMSVTDKRKAVDESKAALAEEEKKYKELTSAVEGAYADISRYEQASTLMLEGETEKAIEILSNYGTGFETVTSTAKLSAEEQKKILEQQVIDTEVNAELMKKAYEDGVEGVTKEMVKTAQEQADAAKEEFLKVGGNITKGIAEGAEGEEKTKWTLSSAMKRLINKAVIAAQDAMDAHSPSRRFKKEVGRLAGLGVAAGIDDSTKDVVHSIKNQVKAMRSAYDLDGISDSVNAGVANRSSGQSGSAAVGRSVVVNQTNVYSQAHSRFELYKSKQQTAAAVRLAMGV